MLDTIGSAAGVVWKFLDENGASSVSKLSKETALDTKLAQRAIGWLAAEGKLKFDIKGRTEIVSLK
ncbi:MAG: winged helix-turn-helix domain-containing protein [Gammaproteobacteria bacterium]|nr:winged helix-turn-helix domain-containing protein [Gammaproteobacteria bacterium]